MAAMTDPAPDSGLRVSEDAAFRELDGEGVILDLESGRSHQRCRSSIAGNRDG